MRARIGHGMRGPEPFVYKILKKENLFLFISILIFFSAATQMFYDTGVATDHFLVGIMFLIGSYGIRIFKDVASEPVEK